MPKVDLILDVSGEVCPVPLVKTRTTIDKMEESEVLLVIGTDEKAKADIIMAVRELGVEIVKLENKGSKWWIFIRKK